MGVAKHNERRPITLGRKYWQYMEGKAQASKERRPWYGRYTVSTEIEKLIDQDMKLKEAGFVE